MVLKVLQVLLLLLLLLLLVAIGLKVLKVVIIVRLESAGRRMLVVLLMSSRMLLMLLVPLLFVLGYWVLLELLLLSPRRRNVICLSHAVWRHHDSDATAWTPWYSLVCDNSLLWLEIGGLFRCSHLGWCWSCGFYGVSNCLVIGRWVLLLWCCWRRGLLVFAMMFLLVKRCTNLSSACACCISKFSSNHRITAIISHDSTRDGMNRFLIIVYRGCCRHFLTKATKHFWYGGMAASYWLQVLLGRLISAAMGVAETVCLLGKGLL